jgi:hypothetical protein
MEWRQRQGMEWRRASDGGRGKERETEREGERQTRVLRRQGGDMALGLEASGRQAAARREASNA